MSPGSTVGKAAVIAIHPEHPQPRLIAQVVDCLRADGLIVHPTDTTYAIGTRMSNKRGVELMYQLKKKSLKRPLSFLCRDLSNIAEYAKVGDDAYRTMKRLLPGPFTMILEAKKNAPRITQTPRKEIGIRVPDDAICRAIIEALGEPLLSTSAYVHDGELLADPDEILHALGGYVDIIIDAGYIHPEPSTIVSFVNDRTNLVRQGKGAFEV